MAQCGDPGAGTTNYLNFTLLTINRKGRGGDRETLARVETLGCGYQSPTASIWFDDFPLFVC
jgi:hypothetical protein